MTKPSALAAALFIAAALVPGAAFAQNTQESPPAREEPVEIEAPPAPADERPAADPPARTPRAAPAPPPGQLPDTVIQPPVVVEQVPVPVPVPVPQATDPLLVDNSVELLPEPMMTNEVEVLPNVVTTTTEEGGGLGWPLIVVAILLTLGAIAFLLARGGRRRPETVVHREVEEAPVIPIVPAAAAPAPPPARPRIDLRMRPLRAGFEGEGARVEFELTVLNEGAVPADNVRVFTWMTSGAQDPTRALLPPPGHVGTPPVTLAAGEARTLQASVAMARSEIAGQALLPVVAADIRYALPGGGEGRTAAAFRVGLPAGDDLGAFALDAPGLHQGVVALQQGQTVRT